MLLNTNLQFITAPVVFIRLFGMQIARHRSAAVVVDAVWEPRDKMEAQNDEASQLRSGEDAFHYGGGGWGWHWEGWLSLDKWAAARSTFAAAVHTEAGSTC